MDDDEITKKNAEKKIGKKIIRKIKTGGRWEVREGKMTECWRWQH